MKKISDYKDEEAIELWGDLLDPMIKIFADKDVAKAIRSGAPAFVIAKEIIKKQSNEAKEIMLRIDPEPIDGINFVTRLVSIVMDFMNNDTVKDFFASAGQEKTEKGSTGSATANIKVVEA